MREINFDLVELRIEKIKSIWEHFILEYRFCNSKIKFTEDVQSNYVADIIGYFSDTNSLIINHFNMGESDDTFTSAICFLQSIYVQQDFIEELLIIFKCNTTKGMLKKDNDYNLNREIRNELIGHPLRKIISKNGKQIVASSTLFHFAKSDKQKIAYLRYHHENDYKIELISVSKEEILTRHINFLNKYIDKIIESLLAILDKFNAHVKKIEEQIHTLSFERIVAITHRSYELIYSCHKLYNPAELKIIWAKRNEHERYQNLIDNFYANLKGSITETKAEIRRYKQRIPNRIFKKKTPNLSISYEVEDGPVEVRQRQEVTYHYELSKLSEIRPYQDFLFFSSLLELKCREMPNVLYELNRMKNNLDNEIEYLCSYYLLAKWLKY